MELSNETLLEKVYMGQTKQRIPKDIFVGRIVLEIGVRS